MYISFNSSVGVKGFSNLAMKASYKALLSSVKAFCGTM